MEMSTDIKDLAAAMAKAQAKMTGAKKDSDNPFFKSKYADLASVREACLPAMNAVGLSVLQFPRMTMREDGGLLVEVETIITHETGQFIRDTLSVPVGKPDAQAVGSAISYARRYALSAIAGVAPEDDDGNAAVSAPSKPKVAALVPKGYESWLEDLQNCADEGTAVLQEAWRKSPAANRAYLTASNADLWDTIKTRAARVPAEA